MLFYPRIWVPINWRELSQNKMSCYDFKRHNAHRAMPSHLSVASFLTCTVRAVVFLMRWKRIYYFVRRQNSAEGRDRQTVRYE